MSDKSSSVQGLQFSPDSAAVWFSDEELSRHMRAIGTVESKSEFGATVLARISVAFNVGDEIGGHMVPLHNERITLGHEGS